MLLLRRLGAGLLGLALALGVSLQPGTVAATSAVPFFLGNSGGAAVPGGDLVYANDHTQGTLVSQTGPALSITRATTSTTLDHEGLIRPILSGEKRSWKLRRVENLVTSTPAQWSDGTANFTYVVEDSETLSVVSTAGTPNGGVPMADSGGTPVAGGTYRFSVELKADFVRSVELFRIFDGVGFVGTTSKALTSDWQRYAFTATVSASASQLTVQMFRATLNVGEKIYARRWQLEHISGQAITAPSEYVSKGVASTPWHGAGVDGVKYFSTANGNTVASNVVTEATGASLTLTAAGISVFGAATHIALHNRDLTNAAWVKGATATVAKDQTGADGVANSASRITAGAVLATNTVLQTVTLASSSRSQEAYIKRLVGTGTVEMTTDNGTSWINITSSITASWTRIRIPVQTVTNPVFGFRLTTNADAIAVDYVTNTSVVDAPVIQTAGAAVTVNADVITATQPAGMTEGTLYVRAIGPVGPQDYRAFMQIDDGTNNERAVLFANITDAKSSYIITDGGASQVSDLAGPAWTAGVSGRAAGRYKLNDSNSAFNGTARTADTSCTMPTTTTIRIGSTLGAGLESANTVLQYTALYRRGFSDAELVSLTQ